MRVLPSPPAWSYVQSQLQTLRKAENGITPEARAEIEEKITTYFEALRQNAEPLEHALYCATVLSTFVEEPD